MTETVENVDQSENTAERSNAAPEQANQQMPPVMAITDDPYASQANAIIAGAVAATAGMGWLPAFVDTGWLVVANSGMVTALAAVYHFKWTGDNTRAFIQRLISDGGITIMAVKGLSALLDLTGIGVPLGIAINGTLNAGLTLAIGKAAQHYFKNAGDVPDDDLIAVFRAALRSMRLLP